MGDATVLSRMMRTTHQLFPTVPLLAVAKEISLEDVRLGLEKMPDRFYEHGNTVLVITNLSYANAPALALPDARGEVNWQVVKLEGSSSNEFGDQIEALEPSLAHGWETTPNPQTGNPTVVRPIGARRLPRRPRVRARLGDPAPGQPIGGYDLVLASQPWRARTRAQFKASEDPRPARALARPARAPAGRAVLRPRPGARRSSSRSGPARTPSPSAAATCSKRSPTELGARRRATTTSPTRPTTARCSATRCTRSPRRSRDRIGTSTLFAAWNAVIYVNQIEDERLDPVVTSGAYLEATQQALHEHGGLWFNDEAFVVARHGS